MPVIRVVGLDASKKACKRLIGDLKYYVSSIDELHISMQQVTPIIHTDVIQENSGEVVVVYVDGLFDKADRTSEVRQRLAKKIFSALCAFIKKEGLKEPKFIEVHIYRIKPDEDGYCSGNVDD